MHRLVLLVLAALAAACDSGAPGPPPPSGTLLISMQAPNGGRGDIYSIRADGTGLRNLTRTADPEEVAPTWSPDGRRIAFVRNTLGRDRGLYVMDFDGRNARQIVPGEVEGAAWAPSGDRIAYVADRPPSVEDAVWTIHPDGTARTLVGGKGSFPEDPTWSPDGRRIAFSSDVPRGGSDDTRIWVMNDDGSDVHAVSKGDIDIEPTWSPDGDRILFVRGFEFIETDPDRIDERPVRAGGMVPAWSPTGEWVAAVQVDGRTTGYGVYAIPRDGGEPRLILRLRGLVFSRPAWTSHTRPAHSNP